MPCTPFLTRPKFIDLRLSICGNAELREELSERFYIGLIARRGEVATMETTARFGRSVRNRTQGLGGSFRVGFDHPSRQRDVFLHRRLLCELTDSVQLRWS